MAEVRAAVPDDAAGIAMVHAVTWQAAYRGLLPDAFLDGLSGPDALARRAAGWKASVDEGVQVVAAVGAEHGEVLAFAASAPSRDADAAPGTGEVVAIYCHPDAWGGGYGRAVHDAALAGLAGSGLDTATLWVLAGNDRARAFYERQGWQVDLGAGGSRRDQVAGTDVDEVRYRRALPL